MSKLPREYASCELLPFNRQSLAQDFELQTPDKGSDGEGVCLLLRGTRVVVCSEEEPELPTLTRFEPLLSIDSALHIGRWQGKDCRLLVLPGDFNLPPDLRLVNLLDAEPGLPLSLLSLAGVGNSILHWEKTSRCCDNCGGTMTRIPGEWGKACQACNAQHYPRIHPCIIVLVRRGNEILLVRKPEWAAGRFGLVAGFVEFGENLEETVHRELFEETGIRVTNLRYHGSQSWPFPSQLMTGFSADFLEGEILLQEDELDEAGWYSLEALPQLPPRRSIARWLIDEAVKDLQKCHSMIES